MKTKKSQYFALFFWLIMITACNSFLDVPELEQTLPSENAIITALDVKNALIGSYSRIKQAGSFGCNIILCSDILADNGDYLGSWPYFRDIYRHQMAASNLEVEAMWRESYKAINQANLVLESIETIDDPALIPQLANQYRGEALFIRAVTHFELVRYFGQPFGSSSPDTLGVPIMKKATTSGENVTFPKRNSVKEVYESAIADLDSALIFLPTSSDPGRANRYSALAYLARIYFQMRDYVSAADYAQQVIEGPYSLNSSPVDFFTNEGSSEEIWAIKETSQDNPGRNASLTAYHHPKGRGGEIVISKDLDTNGYRRIISPSQSAALMQDSLVYEDLRFTKLTSGVFPKINSTKYEEYTANSDDAPILRLAEIILIRAESMVHLIGPNQESISLLNEIRTRSLRVLTSNSTEVSNSADYISYKLDDLTHEELIEAIILERRVEFCFEGNRFHDLCRLQRDFRQKSYTDMFLRFPIPQREMDVNYSLEQNPGY